MTSQSSSLQRWMANESKVNFFFFLFVLIHSPIAPSPSLFLPDRLLLGGCGSPARGFTGAMPAKAPKAKTLAAFRLICRQIIWIWFVFCQFFLSRLVGCDVILRTCRDYRDQTDVLLQIGWHREVDEKEDKRKKKKKREKKRVEWMLCGRSERAKV